MTLLVFLVNVVKEFRKLAVLNNASLLKTAFSFCCITSSMNTTMTSASESFDAPDNMSSTPEQGSVPEQFLSEQSLSEQSSSSDFGALPDFAMDSPSPASDQPKGKAKAINLGTLYIVSTPIGNNEDISNRALKTLKQADIVVGEEGKTVARLLHDHRITKKLEELNEHNENEQTRTLMQLLKNGKTLALVSDAGTPLLADPGAQLVRKAIEAGIPVRAIPGVTSIMAALTTSGLPMDSFVFAGFVSREPGERLQELKRLAQEPRTVALLETPYRLVPLLEAARQIMPQRRAYLGCNLTMDSETHHYGTVSELYTKFVVSRFKGEFVFCFEGVKGGQSPVPQSNDSARDDRRERRPMSREGGNRDGGFRRESGGGSGRDGGFRREGGGGREGGFKRDSGGGRDGGFKREGGSRDGGSREGGFKRESGSGGSREGGFRREGGGNRESAGRDGGFKREGGGGDFRRGGRPDGARGGGFKREGNFRREGGDKPRGDKPQGNQPQANKPPSDTPKSE